MSGSSTQAEGAYGYANNASDSEPVVAATASGDAGLFCEGERSFSVTNLWGDVKDLEANISSESANNESEDLARNAALAAAMFGTIVLFLVLMEMVLGFRICFDRWILGLISLMACISQGMTFLFFNSERYW